MLFFGIASEISEKVTREHLGLLQIFFEKEKYSYTKLLGAELVSQYFSQQFIISKS